MFKAAAYSAVLFGIVTMIAGARVLLGADPGYVVYLPLLWSNTIMGAAYVLVGILALKSLGFGVHGAALICALNLSVLGAVLYKYTPNGFIAETSVVAMTFRTLVWLALFLIFAAVFRRNKKRNAA
ncbi:MAG: hypothetical protein IH627_06900 [Rubrivivax sp.]|nr:hypothetical protein [Rubrivivax sp.]